MTSESTTQQRCLCLITHARYPIGEPRAERAARAACEAGYHVEVIALWEPGEPPAEILDGVQVRRLPIRHVRGESILRLATEYLGFTALSAAAVMALRWRRRLDIVQVHTPPEFLVLAGLLPKALGARLVLDIRDLSPHLWNARFAGGRTTRTERTLWVLVRLACRLADDVITVHEPYRRELNEHGVRGANIAVVMNTPDEALLAGIQTRFGKASDDPAFLVAYHGTITEWYGVDLLIRAVAELARDERPVRALVLGDGDALPRVDALARELGVADRIVFSRRYLPISDALQAVAGASCGVLPNLPGELNQFILSNKLFEYVALRIPVVAARLETIEEYFDDDEVTFFDAGNLASLVAALRWVAEHAEEAAARAERATQRGAVYAWAEQRRGYLSVIGGGYASRGRLRGLRQSRASRKWRFRRWTSTRPR